MFPIFKKISGQQQMKEHLFAFLAEMEKNLEFFYVMDQRQFISHGFLNETWVLVKDMDPVKRHESVRVYVAAIDDFNRGLKDFKEFETWYASDINHKSPENARKLHAMKHELDKKLRDMEAIIIPAGQDLERDMVQLGLLKA